jgi:4-amino-4-deoxy-L-arabinose transferase-like glycosyltransferase
MINKFVFAAIFLLFLVTRIYKIADIPGSVYWDEASIGYNAYCIATDLKDEWGDFLPLHFRAFGEFKLPVYIYSTAVLVKAIGLNAYAVRLPAVLYSLGTLVVVYLLSKKITGKEAPALIASFIFTVSPWFFIFSRTGYEATAGLFFFLLATYLFLEDKLLISVISFILSFYSYNSFRIIIPIWLIMLVIYKFKELKQRKYLVPGILSILLFAASLYPVYRLYRFDAGGERYAQVAITSKLDFVKNYVSHFSPNFLFLKGDSNPRSQIPGHGQLYFIDIPFLLLGLIAVFRNKKILYYLPLALILIAPIPAALTKESPHALRSLLAAPGYAMLAALGVDYLGRNIKKYSTVITIIAVVGYCLSFEMYGSDFFTKYSVETASDWQYQYKEIFSSQKSGVVTDKYAQPYIFALYYLKYPPQKFRDEVKLNPVDQWGFSKVASFNGFQFK